MSSRKLRRKAIESEGRHAKEVKRLRGLLDELGDRQEKINASRYRLPRPKVRKPPKRGHLRVILSDLHGEHLDAEAWAAVVADIKTLEPREVIILGDWMDCGGWLSDHDSLWLSEEPADFAADVAAASQTLDDIERAAPKASILYLEGNHEWRIIKSLLKLTGGNKQQADWLMGFFGVRALLNLDDRGVDFHRHDEFHGALKVRGTVQRGEWLFTHGPFKRGGKSAPDRNLMALKANFCQGHIHRALHATQQSAHVQTLNGYSFGCLCKMAPSYGSNSPCDWSHGYGLQDVASDGSAATWPVGINEGVSRLSSLQARLAR